MIESLVGRVLSLHSQGLCLEVQGVGYGVKVPSRAAQSFSLGQEIKLFTSLFFKDERLVLYGFSDQKEKYIFELLLETQGVGPKMAQSLLDTCGYLGVIEAIQSAQPDILQAASGVGKKIAQRIVFELEAKLKKLIADADWQSLALMQPPAEKKADQRQDLISALENMGFSGFSVRSTVQEVFLSQISFAENLKNCLKKLQK